VNLALSIALVRHIGLLGVIGGTILSYLFVLVVPQTMIVRSLFKRELAIKESHHGDTEATEFFLSGSERHPERI
jgi:CDP-diglyceride synthetase